MKNRNNYSLKAAWGLFLLLMSFLPMSAQVTVQVGTGTVGMANNPINSNYGYTYSQQIYTAADIIAAGGYAGTSITKIRFNLATTAIPTNSNDWVVYMANSSRTQFASNTDWEAFANLSQVFTGSVSFPGGANNWVEVTLSTPFVWNGTSNIVVAVDENTPNFGTSYNFNGTATGATNRSIYYRVDAAASNPNPATPPTATGRNTSMPNIQFVFSQTPCAGTPAPGNTISSLPAVCVGGGVTLSLQNNYIPNSGITYQWQSFDGTNWNNIAGATSATAALSGLTATADYRAKLVCGGTDSAYSNTATVVVNPLPTVSINPAQSIACASGDIMPLTASGADTYVWSPATGLSGTTGASVNATVTTSRTYTVVGTTTATGCTSTATATVSTIGLQGISVSKTPALSCTSGSLVSLNVTNNPVSPAMEYQWYDSLGAVIQPWTPTAAFAFVPATDGAYKIGVRGRIASCPANETFTHFTTFNVGFSANVNVNDVYCGQTTGSIVVTNPKGPGINEIWYSNDFNSAALFGAQLTGNASITGNRLQLTPNVTTNSGAALISNPNSINPKALNLEFDLTVGGGQNNSTGADGLSWSFGPDVVTNPTAAENGSGTGLRIGFDAYGAAFPNQAGLYIIYNSTLVDFQQNSPGVVQYLNNLTWKAGTKHVSITISETGLFTMKFNTTTIFNNVQLPAAYVSANKSTWKHVFAARTGGVAENHEIDNLFIKYSNTDYGIIATGGGVPSTWQANNTFSNVAIGSYDVYIANANDHNCNKFLGTYVLADSSLPAPGNTYASAANICANNTAPVNLSLQNNYSIYTGITWQWQSFDGTNWNDISGATGSTYSFTALPQTTDFRAKVSCDTNSTGISNVVTVVAVQPPTIVVTPGAVTLCTGEIPTLTASGADTYVWSPNTGLSGTTGASVQASPTTYQTYTITGTSTATGCVNTTTSYVTPIQHFPVTAEPTAQICTSGLPVTLDVTSIPDYVAGFGTLEYQWLDSTNTIVQNWSAASAYTFTPATEGYYFYYVNMRSTMCDSVPDTKKVEFYVGFGGQVSTIDINCYIPTGTITISDYFGQGTAGSWFSNDFSSTPSTTLATFHQNGSVVAGRAVLTPSATANRGGLTILNPAGIPGTNVQYDITFKMTADQPINTFGTGGADGIAYSFGPDANYSNTLGNPCSGFGSKLRIVFDAAGNSAQNSNAVGIYVSYGYGGTDQVGPNLATTLFYSPNTALWKIQTDIPVAIKITTDGKLTLTVNNTVVCSNVQLPPDFQSTNKATWKHLFSAQTGGDAMRQAVDDVNIQYSALNFGIVTTGAGLPTTWQESSIFTGVAAGDYDVYISSVDDTLCNKLLGTFPIIDRNPHVDWPLDTVLCTGQSFILDAGNQGSFYEWSTGESGIDEQLYTVTGPGTYTVDVTDTIGCTTLGYISVAGSALPVVSLGADTSICSGITLTLDAGADGTPLWNDGTTTQTLNVNTTGNYFVTVTNADGCNTTDAISVTILNPPSVTGIGATPNGQSVAFVAQTPLNVSTYEWNFGDGNTITTLSPNINYNYANCGTYNVTLTVENDANCGTDNATTSVTFICTGIEETDADAGLNIYPNPASSFIAIANPNGLTIEKLTVLDATGRLIFQSTNSSNIVPDITTWASGMYTVKIDADGKTFVKRLIIGK